MINKFVELHHAYEYIDTQDALTSLCEHCLTREFITLDTEFVRSRTFYPALGLVQIFDGERVYLIDTVVLSDLRPLRIVLEAPHLLKVIHSCSEDLDALNYNVGAFPQPLFDTQIAASFLDMGNSVGYAYLVENLCEVVIDKTESRTDWIQRPLSEQQLRYAAADVTYLYVIYQALSAQVQDKGWSEFVLNEANLMINKKANSLPSEFAYLSYSNAWKLRGKQLLALKLLAQWRLDKAKQDNIAINFILRENAILELAMKLPETTTQLGQLYSITSRQRRQFSSVILGIMARVKAAPADEYPAKIQRLIDFTEYKKLSAEVKQLIETVACETTVPAAVISSKKQINDVFKWLWFSHDENALRGVHPDLLSPWRRHLMLDKLERILESNMRTDNVIRRL